MREPSSGSKFIKSYLCVPEVPSINASILHRNEGQGLKNEDRACLGGEQNILSVSES